MKARELIKSLRHYNNPGLTEDEEVVININGRMFKLKGGVSIQEIQVSTPAIEHWMENGIMKSRSTHENIKRWRFVLEADVPPPGKTINIKKVEENIRKRITEEYQRANSLIAEASPMIESNGQITLIDVISSTESLIKYIKGELGL